MPAYVANSVLSGESSGDDIGSSGACVADGEPNFEERLGDAFLGGLAGEGGANSGGGLARRDLRLHGLMYGLGLLNLGLPDTGLTGEPDPSGLGLGVRPRVWELASLTEDEAEGDGIVHRAMRAELKNRANIETQSERHVTETERRSDLLQNKEFSSMLKETIDIASGDGKLTFCSE